VVPPPMRSKMIEIRFPARYVSRPGHDHVVGNLINYCSFLSNCLQRFGHGQTCTKRLKQTYFYVYSASDYRSSWCIVRKNEKIFTIPMSLSKNNIDLPHKKNVDLSRERREEELTSNNCYFSIHTIFEEYCKSNSDRNSSNRKSISLSMIQVNV
jgi:hypothetical protein